MGKNENIKVKNLEERLRSETGLRKTYENDLLGLRSKFYSILDALNDCAFITDEHLLVIYANRPMNEFMKKIGFPGNIAGLSVKDFFPMVIEGFEEEGYREIFASGKEIINQEIKLRGKENVILEIRKKPVYENGKVYRVITLIKDITRLHEACDYVASIERKTNEWLNLLPWMIIETDIHGKILNGNKNMYATLGYNEREIKQGIEVFDLFSPDYKARAKNQFLNCIGKVDFSHPAELTAIARNQVNIPVRAYFTYIKDNSTETIRIVLFDITDVKKRDENLTMLLYTTESIIKNLPYGIIMITKNKRIRMVNLTALEILDLEEKNVIGSPCFEILCNNSRDCCAISDQGKDFNKTERTFIQRDGKEVHILVATLSIIYDGEEVLLESFVDISDLKQTQRALKQAKEEAELANAAKSSFLSRMSHELRTPMNAILGYIELLETRIKDPQAVEFVRAIKSSGRDLLSLINDLLDLSKIESGKYDLRYSRTDINSLITEVRNMFYPLAKEKNIALSAHIDERLPALIYTDPLRFKQVLINLVSNAIKYTHEGTVKLTVKSEHPKVVKNGPEETAVCDLIITVEDTGIGIPRNTQEKIFEEFIQLRGSEYQKYGGTGLGLAITKKIVEALHGEISVSSKLDAGSSFMVRYKEVRILKQPDEHKIPEEEFDFNAVHFEEKTVLIVDDNAINLMFLSTVLMETGLKVIEATNGFEAMEILDNQSVDMVITDIMMPKMDGFSLCKKIKENENHKNISVIALTASVIEETLNKLKEYKFDGFLIKPVKLEALCKEIMRFLPYTLHPTTEKKPQANDRPAVCHTTPIKVIEVLHNDLMIIWKQFEKKQPVSEIKSFGNRIIELGNTHNIKPLTDYGESLINSITNFNVEKTLQLLNDYPSFITIFHP